MSKKIPKQYLLSDEEKLEYIQDMSKQDIWDFNYGDTSKIEWETQSLLAEGRKAIEETKTIIAKMTDNGMDTTDSESRLKFYQECIDSFQEVEDENRMIVKDSNTKLMQIISDSDYKVDDDGVPPNIKPNKKDLIDMFCEPKMIEKYKEKYINKELPKDITIDGLVEYRWKMQLVPLAVDLIIKKLGEHHKAQVVNLQKKLDDAKLKITSPQKDRKYFTEKDIKVLPYLPRVWDDNLPRDKERKFLHNQKSWFGMIETETGVGYETIRSIHKKWKNDYKEGKIPEDKLKPLPSSKKK